MKDTGAPFSIPAKPWVSPKETPWPPLEQTYIHQKVIIAYETRNNRETHLG